MYGIVFPIGLTEDERWQRNEPGGVHVSELKISLIGAFAALLTVAAPSTRAESAHDGTWIISIFTTSGPCEPNYQLRGQISNGLLSFAGANSSNFAGRVTPNGAVTVTVSMGEGWGVGAGRLSTNSGNGSWRAKIENGSCSGVWSAQRG